jgi:type I restriction enzyme S subunit
MRLAPLSDVAAVFNGKTPAKSEQRQYGHPVLKIKDVNDEGAFVGSFESFVDHDFARRFNGKLLKEGDMLILNAAHNVDYVGSKQYQVEAVVDGAIATGEWTVLRSNGGELNQAYLAHWIREPTTRFKIKRLVRGIHLYPRDIAELRIPLPPIHEQRRIAAILDKADAIRRKRRQTLAEIDALLRSTYAHVLGHLNPEHATWPLRTIEELASPSRGSMRTGPFGSDLRHSEFVDEGVAVLGIDNAVNNAFEWAERRYITEDKYERLRRYRVYPGDVIVTIMGTTGRSAVVPDDVPEAITTKHLATITPDKSQIFPEVLSFAIHSDPLVIRQIRRANKGAIMSGLNLGIVKSLELCRAPLRLQAKFVHLYKRMVIARSRLSDPQMSGEALFASLSQRAFRGEL